MTGDNRIIDSIVVYQKVQIHPIHEKSSNPPIVDVSNAITRFPISNSSYTSQTIPDHFKRTPPEYAMTSKNLLLFNCLCGLGGEYLLPYFHPLSLSMREHLLWIAHYLCHDLANANAESLECKHLFPVSDREPYAIVVN